MCAGAHQIVLARPEKSSAAALSSVCVPGASATQHALRRLKLKVCCRRAQPRHGLHETKQAPDEQTVRVSQRSELIRQDGPGRGLRADAGQRGAHHWRWRGRADPGKQGQGQGQGTRWWQGASEGPFSCPFSELKADQLICGAHLADVITQLQCETWVKGLQRPT